MEFPKKLYTHTRIYGKARNHVTNLDARLREQASEGRELHKNPETFYSFLQDMQLL